MSAVKEARTRVDDLTNALRVIGEIVADETLKPAVRFERIAGILALYECEPRKKAST